MASTWKKLFATHLVVAATKPLFSSSFSSPADTVDAKRRRTRLPPLMAQKFKCVFLKLIPNSCATNFKAGMMIAFR